MSDQIVCFWCGEPVEIRPCGEWGHIPMFRSVLRFWCGPASDQRVEPSIYRAGKRVHVSPEMLAMMEASDGAIEECRSESSDGHTVRTWETSDGATWWECTGCGTRGCRRCGTTWLNCSAVDVVNHPCIAR